MSSFQKVVSRSKNWEPFFNTTTLAAYHFELQLVTLDSIDSPIIKAYENKVPAARNKVFPLLAHEYTHFIDNIGSLWGRRLLYSYYRGLVAREENKMRDFYWMIEARKGIHRCTSNKYYFTSGPMSGSPPPWVWTLSVGCRFDRSGRIDESDPIPFILFGKDGIKSENLIARMPISPCALSEIRAMAAEYFWIKDEENRLGQEHTPASSIDWITKFLEYIYDDDMLIYTSALHLLANSCKTSDLQNLLGEASALAWVALNFPHSLTVYLRIPKEWATQWKPTHGRIDRITPMLSECDPGFIYTLLCFYATAPRGQAIEEWVEEVLQAATGRSIDEFQIHLNQELTLSTKENYINIDDRRFVGWMDLGIQWASAIGATGGSQPLLARLEGSAGLPLPEVLTADFEIWSPIGEAFDLGDGTSAMERFNHLDKMRGQIDDFLEVCGL